MKFNFLILTLILFVFIGCKEDELTAPLGGEDSDNDLTITQLDTTINVDLSSTTINFDKNVIITIPQGAVSGDTKLMIRKLDENSLPSDNEMKLPDVYDITLGSQNIFEKQLQITLNIDETKLNDGALKYKIGAAYYDEALKKWALFKDVAIDSVNNTISFSTNHLTKISWWHFEESISGYTDVLESSHFILYWTEGSVIPDNQYETSLSYHSAGSPKYVQDILFYLEEAYSAYSMENLTLPSIVKIDVRVKELDLGVLGNTTWLGRIEMSQNIKKNNYFSQQELLQLTCAHELLHYVQDYYFIELFANYSSLNNIKWWMEATAVQADRIVWPNKSKFEAINMANGLNNKGLEDMLHRSWDDCNEDPNFYRAGGFLTYLTTYRNGDKLSIPKIIIESGKEYNNLSYIRDIVDTHLKTQLSSNGIASEYRDYIKWAFEGTGDIKINFSRPSNIEYNVDYQIPVQLKPSDPSWNRAETIPYMSAKVIKIINPISSGKSSFKININKLSQEIDATLYTSTSSVKIKKGELNDKDSLIVNLTQKDEWVEILLINDSKDDEGSFDITVSSPEFSDFSIEFSVIGEYRAEGDDQVFYFEEEITTDKDFVFQGAFIGNTYSANVELELGDGMSDKVNISAKFNTDRSTITEFALSEVIITSDAAATFELISVNIPLIETTEDKLIYEVDGMMSCPQISKLVYTIVGSERNLNLEGFHCTSQSKIRLEFKKDDDNNPGNKLSQGFPLINIDRQRDASE